MRAFNPWARHAAREDSTARRASAIREHLVFRLNTPREKESGFRKRQPARDPFNQPVLRITIAWRPRL